MASRSSTSIRPSVFPVTVAVTTPARGIFPARFVRSRMGGVLPRGARWAARWSNVRLDYAPASCPAGPRMEVAEPARPGLGPAAGRWCGDGFQAVGLWVAEGGVASAGVVPAVGVLITQRSQVQILPPLPRSARSEAGYLNNQGPASELCPQIVRRPCRHGADLDGPCCRAVEMRTRAPARVCGRSHRCDRGGRPSPLDGVEVCVAVPTVLARAGTARSVCSTGRGRGTVRQVVPGGVSWPPASTPLSSCPLLRSRSRAPRRATGGSIRGITHGGIRTFAPASGGRCPPPTPPSPARSSHRSTLSSHPRLLWSAHVRSTNRSTTVVPAVGGGAVAA
jgi:hypothetical protein